MEDWIESIKNKLLAEQSELPPGDWERFEADYLASRRKRRILPWAIASVSAAAAVVAAVLLLDKPLSPDTPQVEPVSIPSLSAEAVEPFRIVEEESPVQTTRLAAGPRPVFIDKQEELPTKTTDALEVRDGEPEATENDVESRIPVSDRVEKSHEQSPDIDLFAQIENLEKPHRKVLAFAPYIKGFHKNGNNYGLIHEYKTGYVYYYSASPGLEADINPDQNPEPNLLNQPRVNHLIPLSFGLDITFAISPRLGLTSGLDLSLYRSNYSTQTGNQITPQTANYLGIPLRLDWTFWNQGRFSAWLGAGGKADYLVYGKYGSTRLKDNTVHWSATGDIGIQYRMLPHVGIFLQPEVSYYFKPSDPAIQTYRTEHPVTFTVGAGLRFSFGK